MFIIARKYYFFGQKNFSFIRKIIFFAYIKIYFDNAFVRMRDAVGSSKAPISDFFPLVDSVPVATSCKNWSMMMIAVIINTNLFF